MIIVRWSCFVSLKTHGKTLVKVFDRVTHLKCLKWEKYQKVGTSWVFATYAELYVREEMILLLITSTFRWWEMYCCESANQASYWRGSQGSQQGVVDRGQSPIKLSESNCLSTSLQPRLIFLDETDSKHLSIRTWTFLQKPYHFTKTTVFLRWLLIILSIHFVVQLNFY